MWKGQERGQGPYYGLEFAFAKCQKGKNEGPDKLCQLGTIFILCKGVLRLF